eukprot:m.31408 g.31408  ORF g.31408 m.31408 type:complete len:484 (-) comp16453_c0_seq1:70-1521(-)
MGKNGKLRKRRRIEQALSKVSTSGDDSRHDQTQAMLVSTDLDDTPDDLNQPRSISETEIMTCARVLHAINAEDFFSKRCKLLRVAMHTFMNSGIVQPGGNSGSTKIPSLSLQISESLRLGDWDVVVSLLAKMRETKEVPKLGSVCRWVRECDALFNQLPTDKGGATSFTALDAILRTADAQQVGSIGNSSSEFERKSDNSESEQVVQFDDWRAFDRDRVVDDFEQTEEQKKNWKLLFSSCFELSGAERNPPNKFPLTIWSSQPNTIDLKPDAVITSRIEAPFVNGAFMLKDLLAANESFDIIKAGEAVGYDPDYPVGGSAVEKQSVLAHACVWLVDDAFHDKLWARAKPFIDSKYKAVGLNRRFRCYRYVPGAEYRPHIDGAWPGSGLDDTGRYIYDVHSGKVRSKLTFLIYLNEDFGGGCTTYYAPRQDCEGVMDRRGVKPRCGSAMVFPHGDTQGALLHEGSGVTRGVKYVIRTDVLCDLS